MSPPTLQTQPEQQYISQPSRCVNQTPFPVIFPQADKISSPTQASFSNTIPLFTQTSALPSQVDLNVYTEQLPLQYPRSCNTISPQDFTVFTTDSQPSTWLPSSSPRLPASSAHQPAQPPNNSLNVPQQDFVLFDSPKQPQHHQHSRFVNQPAATGSVLPLQRQQHHLTLLSVSPLPQNQRVSHIQSAAGQPGTPSTPSVFPRHRFPSSVQNRFYASSAPSSAVALNNNSQLQPAAQIRPPVPPFPVHHNSTGSTPHLQNKMVLEDLNDFTVAGYDNAVFSSPAVGVYDLNASMSSNSSNVGTVSPHDLFLQDSFVSAPSSTALTSLTSPSDYNESPYIDSYDVSPDFRTGDVDAAGGPDAAWFPLFDQINNAVAGVPATDAAVSPSSDSADLSGEKGESNGRRKSGHARSSSSSKHSSISGVSSRRRDKPLAPIVVEDPSDTVAMKRARNTLAARKSRQRKQERLEELEEVIAKLTAERDHWKKMALNQ